MCQVHKKVACMFSAQVMSLSNFLYDKLHYQHVNKLWVNLWWFISSMQGFQYFSSLPVLNYLQAVLFIILKLEQFS